MRTFIVIPPWIANAAERAAFARSAAATAGGDCEVLDCTGRASPAALARRIGDSIDASQRCLVLLPTGNEGEQAAAAVATQLVGSSFGHCDTVTVEGAAVAARRSVFGGRATIAVRSDATVTCATLRPDPAHASAPLPAATQSIALDEPGDFVAEPVPSTAKFPRVEGAGLVVSGGRGIGGDEGFALLARVADALGAGLGGSLPAVDAGWVPVGHQVGQSGKFVSPKVYFAVAISGTPQHLAGIAPTARIVALNNDRDAPIFGRAEVGVEGDWRELLPLLAGELERLRAGS
jgi:electron transfer flavoprotein alpha subunit